MGQLIRRLRTENEYGLNDFAREIGVSPGYLSQLETGKTNNIEWETLAKIDNMLGLFTYSSPFKADDPFVFEMEKSFKELKELAEKHPNEADYLLTSLRHGLTFFRSQS
ncbi:helix-turn-helix domain-containing protein [Alteribacter keqinensis]|nr:helix-turn-helix transcriptional regulator [Alteribacter keqinensis]